MRKNKNKKKLEPTKGKVKSNASGTKVKNQNQNQNKNQGPQGHKAKSQQRRINLVEFIKDFDVLIREKKVKEAQDFLDSVQDLSKWQRLNLQALIEVARGDEVKAEAVLREALRDDDVNHSVNRNLGILLVKQGRMREGIKYAEKAYEKNKKDIKTLHIYVNCLLDLGRSEEAYKVANTAIVDHPEDKLLLVSRASSLRAMQKNDDALLELDALITKFPKEPVVRRIKADLLGDKSSNDALPYYEEALQLSIDNKGEPDPAIMWNMSLHLLRARQLERGWECWEQGFHPVVGTMGRNLPKRINDLERADAKDKSIDKERWTIICSEQGVGDQVLFMHSLHEAIEELGKVLFISEARMHPILKRSFPKMVVANPGMTYDWKYSNLKKNGYIPLGSIPRRHRKTMGDYKNHRKPFLIANKDLYSKYREALQREAGGRPIIGISWKGGFWKIQRKTKALEIEKWENIFKKNALFVNLQYGDVSKEINYLRQKGLKIVTFDALNYTVHLDDWLAIAGACDGIISVSTALVHFAGAIGQKIAIVMPGIQGPWHLGLGETQSLAYKNVRIFRPESRDEPIDNVVQRVADLIIENEI